MSWNCTYGCRQEVLSRRPAPPAWRTAVVASQRLCKPPRAAAAQEPTPQQKDAASLDISSALVSTSYRSTPWAAEAAEAAAPRATAHVLFISESGVCRGPLAAAAFAAAAARAGLGDQVEVSVRASRDYSLGEPPHPAAEAAAQALALPSLQDRAFAASQFNEATDMAGADLVLTFDKYTAADVLREVSVFDTIRTQGAGYSRRVRRLGEFHPVLGRAGSTPDAQDIDDPLYGNVGGEEEAAAVLGVAQLILESCEGLVQLLQRLHAEQAAQAQPGTEAQREQQAARAEGGQQEQLDGLRRAVAVLVDGLEQPAWLVPPMLQRSS